MLAGVLGEPCHVAVGTGRVTHAEQHLTAQQVGVGVILVQGNGLGQHGDGAYRVALSLLCLGVQVAGVGVGRVKLHGLLAGGSHRGVVLLHVCHLRHTLLYQRIARLGPCQYLQFGQCLVEPAQPQQRLRQVVVNFQVFLQLECLAETAHGIVSLSYLHGFHTVILQQVEVLLFLCLLLFFGRQFSAAKQYVPESHILLLF